ncbi:hypothetical protein K1719_032207 [Acacia pycnantha]|nr:hypothetical protein K1719_032207 [Acacia pycnantha]
MEVGKSLDQDVWHVVHKPRRQKRAGKSILSDELRQPSGGSRFDALAVNLEGDYVRHQEKGSGVAVVQPIVMPESTLQIDHSIRNNKGKKGKNQSKKHPRLKATSNSSENVPVSSPDLRNDKRSRGEGNRGFHFGEKKKEETLQVEKVNEAFILGDKEKEDPPNLALLDEDVDLFLSKPHDPGELGPSNKPTGKFWDGRFRVGLIVKWGACSRNLIHHLRIACKGKWPMLLILSETKTDSPSRFHCLERLGYDGLAFIPSLGRSGGLVAVWRSGQGSVSLICSDRQFLHLHVSLKGRNPFLLTTIYVVPSPSCKLLLWQELMSLSSSVSAPWVVLGDFNDILSVAERVGGSGINRQRISQFRKELMIAIYRLGVRWS